MKTSTIRRIAPALIAVPVLAVLFFGVVFVNVFSIPVKDAMRRATWATIRSVGTAMEMYHDDCGKWPPTEGWHHALINDTGIAEWKGPYLRRTSPETLGARGLSIQSKGTSPAFVQRAGPEVRNVKRHIYLKDRSTD